MATGLSSTAANGALDSSILAGYTWIKLHVGSPGSAGTTNAATETTRHQATWAASSGGAAKNSGAITWTNVAGSETYTHFSVWSASTAGTFGFSGTLTANAVTAGDTFTIADQGISSVSFTLAS